MTLRYIIVYSQILAWFLTIFKQRKSIEYKYFFYILATQDIIALSLLYLFKYNPYRQYTVWAVYLFLSLFPYFSNYRRAALVIIISIPLYFLSYHLDYKTANLIITIVYSFVYFFLLRKFFSYFLRYHKILVYHIALITYIFTAVVKMLVLIADVNTGTVYYLIFDVIQIFLAIYFMIDSDYNPKFILYRPEIAD